MTGYPRPNWYLFNRLPDRRRARARPTLHDKLMRPRYMKVERVNPWDRVFS